MLKYIYDAIFVAHSSLMQTIMRGYDHPLYRK